MNNNTTKFQDKVSVSNTVGSLEPEEDNVEYYNKIFQKVSNVSQEDLKESIELIKNQLSQLPL